jgi:hypothetical protein
MSEKINDILNVVQRWEAVGLLDGLPIMEKTELAQIYDNATRLMLSDRSVQKIPEEISEIYDNFYLPICRRLYKRVGPNFNLETMMGKLLEVVNKRGQDILKPNPEQPEKNPVLDFCIEFADNYEDDKTSKNMLSDEEYEQKIDYLTQKIKEILLNENTVSYINKEKEEYNLNIAKTNKPKQQKRFWNQSVAKNLLASALSEINKGL